MRTPAHLISLALAAACATAIAADPAKNAPAAQTPAIAPTVEARQAAIDAAAREKPDPIVTPGPIGKPDPKTSPATDRKTLAAVRRAVVKDKSLSRTAHNVRMVNKGGVITLTGTIKTAAEKDKLEAIAKGVPGVAGVENKLSLKTESMARVKLKH